MDRSRAILFLSVVVLFATSLLPRAWLGWAADAAAILHMPVAPLSHAGTIAASWLRPASTPFRDLPGDVRERFMQMQEERDRFERLYHQSEFRISELQEQIRQLQMIDVARRPDDLQLFWTSIVRRTPSQAHGPVEVKGGGRQSIIEGSAAVYAGVHLLGQVTQVSPLTSTLRPITNSDSPPLRARVWPKDRPDTTAQEALPIRLSPNGDGLFEADMDRNADIAVGDIVRLVDPAWPDAAQLLIIGTVESIAPKQQQPLRNQVLVRPRYQVHEVVSVLLMIQRPMHAELDDTRAGASQ